LLGKTLIILMIKFNLLIIKQLLSINRNVFYKNIITLQQTDMFYNFKHEVKDMAKEVLGKCPVCGNNTQVTKLSCYECGTSIEGSFDLCKFCRLTEDQKSFIDVFIKCRGNIKEVEKELGVSYPTVKNRLEDAASALGYKSEPDTAGSSKRKEILDKLNSGEISVEEALGLLKD
jgi:hypothetical protein